MLSFLVVKLPDGGYLVYGSDFNESNFSPVGRAPTYAHHEIGATLEYIRKKMEKKDA